MEHEEHKASGKYRAYAFALLFLATLSLYLLYIQNYAQLNQNALEYTRNTVVTQLVKITAENFSEDFTNNSSSSKYLVWSSRCKIPNVEPFNDDVKRFYKKFSYTKCTKLPLLTYLEIEANKPVLFVNRSALSYYTENEISCCYSTVTRKVDKNQPDNAIKLSTCTNFNYSTTINEDCVLVKCKNTKTNKEIYKNVHMAITITKNVENRVKNIEDKNHLSILFVGIDSVSRLNFIRDMPKTHSFLETNRWLELKGYNKVADNTFPNLVALLSGMNESRSYAICKPKKIGYLDSCKFLWYDYRDLGFVTSYAEDESQINTFNYLKKGFVKPPTDYYFRPYMLAAELHLKATKVDDMSYCTGPETSGERILHLAKSFAEKFKNHPYFGFYWMNSFSHNHLNSITRMDDKVNEFLTSLWNNDTLNNTIMVFFSDHGLRFGNIRYTHTGWLEERLPIFFMGVPDLFKQNFPEKYKHLLMNRNRLTTPYDVYMTLQELLLINGKNYSVIPSSGCPKCRSLFEEMDIARSCEDASIEQHWCTCGGYMKISGTNSTVKAASKYILDQLQEIVDSHGRDSKKCAKFKLNKIMTASISDNDKNWYKNDTYLLMILETSPSAIFEATVKAETNGDKLEFSMKGSISRLDYYSSHSHCVSDSNLKKYCYCHR